MKLFLFIFLIPFCSSIGAAWYMASSNARVVWRILVVLLVLIAVLLQLLTWFVSSINVHFLIPLMIQIIVSIGVYFYSSFEV
jgi:hypothetical protein